MVITIMNTYKIFATKFGICIGTECFKSVYVLYRYAIKLSSDTLNTSSSILCYVILMAMLLYYKTYQLISNDWTNYWCIICNVLFILDCVWWCVYTCVRVEWSFMIHIMSTSRDHKLWLISMKLNLLRKQTSYQNFMRGTSRI